jgi:phosphatidylglycerol---prolipoprotein diacylglyceryl transferase
MIRGPVSDFHIHNMSPFLIRFGGDFGIRWYGLAYVAAFVLAWLVVRRLSRGGYCAIPPASVGDFITGTALFGVILGGRLGYMLFYDLDAFLHDPLLFFRFWDGGMSSHGGIMGIVVFTLVYARRKGIPWRNIGDNTVVAAPLGLMLGRLANFINGELYGRPSTVPWAVKFPKELQSAPPDEVREVLQRASAIDPSWNSVPAVIDNAGHPALQPLLAEVLSPRHPSQLYQAALEGALLFAILWFLRTRLRLPDGVLTGVFFIGYAILRIVGEVFREPDAPLTAFLTRGQFLSLFLVAIGLGFIASARLAPSWAPRFRK